MLNTRAKKMIASAVLGLAVAVNLPVASLAHDLEPVSTSYSSDQVTAYGIDENRQAVVVAWNATNPTAVLIAIHGFGLHKLSFQQFAEQIQHDGISTYALDVRGFGGWMQSDKHSPMNFPGTMQDLRMLVESIRRQSPDTPIFLMGESMGGAIALSFAAENPHMVEGVISSVPSYERVRPLKTAARIAVSYILSAGGKINLDNVLVNGVTKNKVMRRSWESDSQAKLKVTLKELLSFNRFMKTGNNAARQIDTTPVLVVQGHNDNLVKPAGTTKLFDNLSTKDKQLLVLENGEHLTFEDGQFEQSTVTKLERWLAAHEPQSVIASR